MPSWPPTWVGFHHLAREVWQVDFGAAGVSICPAFQYRLNIGMGNISSLASFYIVIYSDVYIMIYSDVLWSAIDIILSVVEPNTNQ